MQPPPTRNHRNCSRLGLVLIAAVIWAAAGAARAADAPAATRLYVSAEDGGEVVVVDPEHGEVVARIPVGKRPRGIKLSKDGKTLYVALSGSPRGGPGVDESKLPPPDRSADGVGVVDLATHKLVKTLPSGQDPESFDLSRDGKTLYVSNEETAEMSVLDLHSGKVLWKELVDAPVMATPATYTYNGKQYVVFTAGGNDNLSKRVGDQLVAFALPN